MPLSTTDAFQRNTADFRIGGFDIESGETVVGAKDTPKMDDLMRRVRASSTMPIVMPPVAIDGRTYVDGALGTDGGVPLSIAQELGYERFLVVLTQEREYQRSRKVSGSST